MKWIGGVLAAVALLVSPMALTATVLAQEFDGDLTAAIPGEAPFGGGDVGDFEIEWDGNQL